MLFEIKHGFLLSFNEKDYTTQGRLVENFCDQPIKKQNIQKRRKIFSFLLARNLWAVIMKLSGTTKSLACEGW
jgi:hypothetical protein